MLLSMTGFGEAHDQVDDLTIAVEIRSVNSKQLKLSQRLSEGYNTLEPLIEALVRQTIRRGSVQLTIKALRKSAADSYRINTEVLIGYRRQLEEVNRQLGSSDAPPLESLLVLPGVVDEQGSVAVDVEADSVAIKKTVLVALEKLDEMRRTEGQAMAVSLDENCQQITKDLEEIEKRAPLVVEGYRDRLHDRVQQLVSDRGVSLDATDIIREVSIFAERSDIAEEVVRLQSHLAQFTEMTRQEFCTGRKLEFVSQEMFREINTIGSKANDMEIAQRVFSIKSSIERIREMVQNVE